MGDTSLNRRQTFRLEPQVAFAQIGIIGFDGQIELEALRLYGLLGFGTAAPPVCWTVGTQKH